MSRKRRSVLHGTSTNTIKKPKFIKFVFKPSITEPDRIVQRPSKAKITLPEIKSLKP